MTPSFCQTDFIGCCTPPSTAFCIYNFSPPDVRKLKQIPPFEHEDNNRQRNSPTDRINIKQLNNGGNNRNTLWGVRGGQIKNKIMIAK